MPRDVEFNVTASDKTGAALASAERNFQQSQERIDKASKEHAKKRQTDLDESAAKIGRGLEKVFGTVSPKIAQTIAEDLAAAGEAAGPALGVALAAAAPFVGAAVSAAVVGGIGGAGLLGGIALASRSPRVKAAGKEFGRVFLQEATRDAQPLVEPIVQSLAKAQSKFEELRPSLRNIFRDSGDLLDPLVDGALHAFDRIVRGAEKTIGRAGPVFDSLGEGLELIGDSVGTSLDIISGGAESSGDALVDLSRGISALIVSTAGAIRVLTELYDVVAYLPRKAFELGEGIERFAEFALGIDDSGRSAASAVDGIVAAAQRASDPLDDAASSANTLAAGFAAAKAAADGLVQSNRSLYASTGDVEAAFDAAADSVKKNGKTLDENTEKGRANRSALVQTAEAAQKQYENFVRLNGVGPASAALADNLRDRFIKLAVSMGKPKAEAEKLANQLLGIPSRRETRVTVQIAAAQAAVRAIKGAIAGISGKSVTVSVVTTGVSAAIRAGRIISGLNAGDVSWGRAVDDGTVSRTGGPLPVNVTSDVVVQLDGTPFYAMSIRAAQQRSERDAWRQKVGKI